MRILVVSDTHGRHGKFDCVLEEMGKIDYLFHLGDLEGGEDYIEAVCDCPVYMVGGNNDFFSGMPFEREVCVGGKKIFMAHGHGQNVHRGIEQISEKGKKMGADIVMFGHTHKPCLEYVGDMLVLNPGSLTYPRQAGHKPSYIVLNIEENGEMDAQIKYL